MILYTVPSESLHPILRIQESHISQFLANLRPKYELVRTALMNRDVSLDLDCLCTRSVERRIHLYSKHTINKDPIWVIHFTSELK